MTDEIVTDDTIEIATRTHLDLPDFSIDCYMLPDGEKRLGFAGASIALGYNKNWLGRLVTKNEGKQLEALYSRGFTGYTREVRVVHELDGVGGAAIVKTVSKPDFIKLIKHEALHKRNGSAVVILCSLAEETLDSLLDKLFLGESIESFVDKIVHYSQWTHEEWEEALEYNREELENQFLGVW